jgi:hypothetical protein
MKGVPNVIGRKIAHSALLAQKNSPGLLFGAGVVGMVGSTVLACRATLKMEELLWEAKGKLHTAKTLKHQEYSDKDRSRDITLIHVQTGVKIVRLYSPAIIVGGLSIAALTKSHNILNQRNAALTAAYAALEKGFKEYRERVVEKYGEEADRNLRYGTQQVEVTDPETKKKKIVTRVSQNTPSIYARFFDPTSTSWSRDPEYNLIFLKCQQNYANDMLHARGHVFLNEVYDMLGIPRSKAGAVVGWILTPDGQTDNFINFGVFDDKSEKARDFVNGYEGAILLDFNVDGIIYDRIDMSREGEPLSWQLSSR